MYTIISLKLIYILIMIVKCYSISNVPSIEINALHDLYNSTNGDYWEWKSVSDAGNHWNFSSNNVNPCDNWQGISCTCTRSETEYHPFESSYYYFESNDDSNTIYCSIEKLYLIEYNLYGTLPSSIGQLKNLTQLHLDKNYLYSTIPNSLYNLTSLIVLSLAGNKNSDKNSGLSGTLNSYIGNITSLQQLRLNSNLFTGSIPSSISRLNKLMEINIETNTFNGSFTNLINSLATAGTSIKTLNLISNKLTGSIPSSIGVLKNLKTLEATYNKISGSIPKEISNTSITYMALNNNQLTDKLPTELGTMIKMSHLDLASNCLTGSLPSELSNLVDMTYLALYGNSFVGKIPSKIAILPKLSFIDLSSNSLTGSLPLSYSPSIQTIAFQSNYLEGSLPSSICSISSLASLDLEENMLTGVIPNCIGNLVQLKIFNASINSLSGFLPSSIGNMITLYALFLFQNSLSGSLPSTFSNLRNLTFLDISSNAFTGSVPYVGNMVSLQQFFIYDNLFGGSVESIFNPQLQKNILNIDVSSNALTGAPVPSSIYNLSSLVSYAAVKCCFEITIPVEVCSLQNLNVLALDGLKTNDACKKYIFPGSSDTAYVLQSAGLNNYIPTCLFSMNSIETLHIAGNLFKGSLPSNLVLAESLVDLSLSHNIFTGYIPTSVQSTHSWVSLDLSYNQFSGYLNSDFYLDSENSSLSLEVNRLSGTIASGIIDLYNINVLSGNMFSCSRGRTDLPLHDPEYESYNCGSEVVYSSIYVWLALVFFITTMATLYFLYIDKNPRESTYFKRIKVLGDNVKIWLRVCSQSEINAYNKFADAMKNVRMVSILMTFGSLFFLLPVYAVLSKTTKTKYTNVYIWLVSPSFLAGSTAALATFFTFVIYLISCYWICKRYLIDRYKSQENHQKNDRVLAVKQYTVLGLIGAVNVIVVGIVNVYFVYALLKLNSLQNTLVSVAMSVFKLVWGYTLLPLVVKNSKFLYSSKNAADDLRSSLLVSEKDIFDVRNVSFLSLVSIFNVILVPSFVVAFVSPDCFYNTIVASPTVVSQYQYSSCFDISSLTNECRGYQTLTRVLEFDPPYNYNYMCSSELVTNYITVFVYMFLSIAFVTPVKTLTYKMVAILSKGCLAIQKAVDLVLDKKLEDFGDVISGNPHRISQSEKRSIDSTQVEEEMPEYVDGPMFTISIVSYLSILLTFCITFPPLSIMACVAICSETYFSEVLVGRVLHSLQSLGRPNDQYVLSHLAALETQCDGISEYIGGSIVMLFPLSQVFLGFFIFDLYDYEASTYYTTKIIPILMITSPVYLWLLRLIYQYYNERKSSRKSSEESQLELEKVVRINQNTIDNEIISPLGSQLI